MKVSIIIPTLNEHGNISILIERIIDVVKKNNIDYELIIIDDNSTDGTIDDIKGFQKILPNLKIIVRDRAYGIGNAHRAGYNLAQGDLIIAMDADLSHPPEIIPEIINKVNRGYDIVIGSRYIENAGSNKGLFYKFISKLGSLYLSLMLRVDIKDFSNGYRAIKKKLWEKIKDYEYTDKNNFLIETVYYAVKNGASVSETPAFFKDREIGESKTPLLKESIKAIILPFRLKFHLNKKR